MRARCPFVFAILAALLAPSVAEGIAQSATITGSVEEIDAASQEVVIAIEGDLLPRVGDPVAFWGTVAGVRVRLGGTWEVSGVEGDSVLVRPTDLPEGTSMPGRDYTVEIGSANPRPKPVFSGNGARGPLVSKDLADDNLVTPAEILDLGGGGTVDDAEALRREGARYYTGDGVPRDYDRARRLFEQAAEAGSTRAMLHVGWMFEEGIGVTEDDARAVEWYRRAAAAGDAQGQRSLGFMYQRGHGAPQDYQQAIRLYRMAAAQGHPDATNDLGVMYENGWGVARDYAEAMRMYEKAADLGLANGYFNMAELYENGRGVPVDEQRAVELYREAARRGHEVSQRRLQARGLGW